MGALEPQTKQDFLATLSDLCPDLFLPEEWDSEQRARAMEMIRPPRTRTSMFTSIPMVCRAKDCPFARSCPLLAEHLAPKGKPCPLEMAVVSQFMQEYMEDLGVDIDNLVEVSMIRDLVDQEVQYLRKTKLLADEHFIQENVIGIDQDGNPVVRKELHLAVELEDRLHRRKKDLRNQLLATREARAKVGQTQLDTAQTISNIMDSVREIQAAKEKAARERMGHLWHDEYIDGESAEAEVVGGTE